jgi:FkbM family methyltransferase
MDRAVIIDLLRSGNAMKSKRTIYTDAVLYTLEVIDPVPFTEETCTLLDGFQCPSNMVPHCRDVMIEEEYDCFYYSEIKRIVDVGANVGSFACWAAKKFPESRIDAYEPLGSNFDYLVKNTAKYGHRIQCHNWAIGNPEHTRLFLGKNNCGEGSFYQNGEQREDFVQVETRSPSTLPPADLLKLDTEGCELEILRGVDLAQYRFIALEYHRESDRREIDALLKDYALLASHATSVHRGVVIYGRVH